VPRGCDLKHWRLCWYNQKTGRHAAMRRARYAATIAVVAAGLLGPSIQASRAVDSATCTAYANAAVAAANEVRKLGCDYDLKNPQWSTDFNAHMRWCRFVEQSSVDHEKANREAQLNHCRSCAEYANTAVRVTGEVNKVKVCVQNPGDPRWSTDPAVHRRWCLKADSESVKYEGSARENERFYCLHCASYAHKAVSQYERAKACLGKPPSGQQWSSGFTDHYYWCRERWLADASSEQSKREKEVVGFCTQSTKKGLSTSTAVTPRRVDPARPKSESKGTSSDAARAANPCQPGKVNDPCKSKSRVLSPSLLEGGGGGGRQGPSAVGSPTGGAGGGAPAGLGDSYRVR
jgi:hypothetical protein